MDYDFREIEQKWQKSWKKNNVYKVDANPAMPKFYVLDMFPYPSGAGLHVGHPLGYIASDIFSRYKRHCGFNVLHPMGYDAFGLPAEQYAIQTGQHPAVTTDKNIRRYREQLDKIGFCYDWDREVRTCDPAYYHWTQWVFIEMFSHFYNNKNQKAEPIGSLIAEFEKNGNTNTDAASGEVKKFTAAEWKSFSENEKLDILMNYRIAYLGNAMVNWCPALGTVLANDEVKEGISMRGGHPVEQKNMKQWQLRISAYAQRLLNGLDKIDWTESLKEIQRYWIGRSEGAEMIFELSDLSPALSKGEGAAPRYQTADPKSWKYLKDVVKENRKNPTPAEEMLWDKIRAKKLDHKIRRQHMIGPFIVDFACLSKKTIIEVDGKYHDQPETKEYDEKRNHFLNNEGYNIIRVTNEEVLKDPNSVAEKLKEMLDKVPSSGGDLGEADSTAMLIFTTRPDTIFGVTFMVLAPESEWVRKLTTPDRKPEVEKYVAEVKKHNERERLAETKQISGVFSGSYAIHPFSGKEIPIWISEYVLAGYGTGAIMAVPAHDSRDYAFARHFKLPIIPLIEGCDISNESFDAKEGKMINSDFLNGLNVKDAIKKAIGEVEKRKIGTKKVNFRLRDAIFSRQRYWGEPFPVYYKDGQPYTIDSSKLPLVLPEVDKYLPTETGEPPLGRAKNWQTKEGFKYELSTMPGFAGSSAYYLRYMDPKNNKALVSKEANNYWQDVDLYIGGTEHATGHLIYSRFWNKFLFDLGLVCKDEPFKKLINQGMIQGRSNFVYRIKGKNTFVSLSKKDSHDHTAIHVDVNIVDNDMLDIDAFRNWNPEYKNAEFIFDDDGKYRCGWAVEKMSKSMFNVVNPDIIIEKYGADTLRMYEMFLGPLEQSKPWDTKGIDGVHRFLKKFWRLFHDENNNFRVSDEKAGKEELKPLHKTIKKITQDIEAFSFNTSVSQFMICINELTDLKCGKREILEQLVVLLSPFAPHIAEELWCMLGHNTTVCDAQFPVCNDVYLVENTFEYPVSFNGKLRFKLELPLDLKVPEIEKAVLEHENAKKYLSGNAPKKIIVVPGKIVNVVI